MLAATMSRGTGDQGHFIWRVGSLLGLVGLILGLPLALIVTHVTPPLARIGTLGAHPGSIAHFLNAPLSDTAVARCLTCAAWMIWLWLLVCSVVETLAVIHGRPPRHLPASRHIQSLISTLVGASLAVVPLGRDGLPMRFQVSQAPIHRSVGVRHVDDIAGHFETGSNRAANPPMEAGKSLVEAEDRDQMSPTSGASSYVVKAGDTLWSIAERQLGSPLRWRAIAELNYGRSQPDGGKLTDAHWIFPGWELILPNSPSLNGSQAVAERLPEPIVDPLEPPKGVPDGAVSQIPVLTRPGDSPEGGRVHPTLKDSNARRSEARESSDRGHPRPPLPLNALSYGVLGAGVIALLERMRRGQRRHRRSGLRIVLPDGDLMALERQLHVEADPEGVDIIDLGLRALVVCALRCGSMPPQATIVRLGSHSLEIALDPHSHKRVAPEPFTSDTDATSWFLSRDHTTMQRLREDPDISRIDAPFPALVSVGRDEFGAVVLVDLEQAASIDVTGDNSEGILGTIAVEMATAKWADQVELILVGFNPELETLERVSHVASIGDVISKVQRRVRERTALLASVGRQANWEIRWTEGGDAWDLCVVVCSPVAVCADRQGAEVLVNLAGDGGMGLTVVLGSPTGAARWHLGADDGRIELKMNRATVSTFTAHPVDVTIPNGVASLVNIAGQLEGVEPAHPPYDGLVTPIADQVPQAVALSLERHHGRREAFDDTDPLVASEDGIEIEVRVLGPVEIVGASRPFTRAWAVELIVYLAMHRNGASSEQWATALWPDRIMAAASLHSTASAARRSLGTSTSGEDHLPRAHGRLALGPGVTSDWNRFVELSDRLEPDSWQRALELIRGRPFEGLRAPDWVLLEGIAANVEAIVVDVSCRFAEHCLSVGDPGTAQWSARQGLQVSAYDERLYRILLRAADAAGNPAGVESVMTELVRLVAEDVEPYDAVHPETLDLYRTLSRRSTPSVTR